MTDQEILQKAIEKAIAGGYTTPHEGLIANYWVKMPEFFGEETNIQIEFVYDNGFVWTIGVVGLIYNHDFAKALWGEEPNSLPFEQIHFGADVGRFGTGAATETRVTLQAWQYHLQQMVISPSPLKYLESNI